ncbi:SAF domain-containing protein [Sciscionella marina]|uniref:SAF domain-containing protein n=1 Tax=Sciscionella marina TaxID=508770 RepID=UPI001F094090|nr:SAF domain-containing protein [Sciscionella marina]
MTSTHTSPAREGGHEASGAVSWMGQKGNPGGPVRTRVARRRVPHLVLGLLLVVVCVGGAVWWSTSTQDRVPVLAIARPVTVGHVLERADLRSTEISAAAGVATVPAAHAGEVLGRPMATSLGPGALITPDSVGAAAIPGAGQSVVAVGLKPGAYPPELAAGAPVSVVVTNPATGSTSTGDSDQQASVGSMWPATVVGRAAAGDDQTTVISLQLASATATELAQVPTGQVALVLQPGGR